MNIGIIVYSQTGNTLHVAEKLKDRLIREGHSVNLEQITVVGGRTPKTKQFELATKPDAESYDAIVFGSAVEAFSLSEVLSRYLNTLGSLQGKRVACLVSQQFPYPSDGREPRHWTDEEALPIQRRVDLCYWRRQLGKVAA